jgi:hypothetical protein
VRVGIIQSNYIPWRGYFDFIDDVDLFIFHDDLQYTKGDWRNRNKIKTPNGLVWLTVPVRYHKTDQIICETPIDDSQSWCKKHINQIIANYSKAPFFHHYADEFFAIIKQKFETISDLNVMLTRWIMEKLSITTPLRMSSEFEPAGTKTDRLIDILKKVGATIYLSGPSAKDYLETEKFAEACIELEYKSYVYREYLQLWGQFEPTVTILDLLFNCGEHSRDYLKSLKENEKVAAIRRLHTRRQTV